MGPVSNAWAVMDPYGRMHGLAGLRVVDASGLPDCPRANTNVVTMMFGERIADEIWQGL
jgi:5-(hydroxymethyl)furfural/furfural oxidase